MSQFITFLFLHHKNNDESVSFSCSDFREALIVKMQIKIK